MTHGGVQAPDAPAPRGAGGGYRKGEETRQRILAAALAVFGASGFDAVTTRRIAEHAGVKLPALTYYFGGKEGLYRACAHDIVQRWREGVGAVALEAQKLLQGTPPGTSPAAPADAACQLKRLMGGLAHFLLSAGEGESRTLFVQREIASPGPAFEILYAELWRPGIELAAALIERAAAGGIDSAASRVRAAMMIGSLTGLVSGHNVVVRAVGGQEDIAPVLAALDEQIDALVRAAGKRGG